MPIFRIYWRRLGGHIHMRAFAAVHPNAEGTKMGDLCVRDGDEWRDLRLAMRGVTFREEEGQEQ